MNKPLIALVGLVAIVALAGAWLLCDFSPEPLSKPPMPEYAVSPELVQAALEPYREALEASRRPVVQISLVDFPEDEPLASKVGGSAWWPRAEAAPVGEDGSALVLLAQINFGEMPASTAYPDSGLLQFFIAPDDYYGANFDSGFSVEELSEQRNFRVVYWPDTSGPEQTLPPQADEDYMTPHLPDKPRRMQFAAGQERMSSSDYRFDQMLGGNGYERFEAWADENGHDKRIVDDIYLELDGSGHKFGGYPYFTQSDPRAEGPYELLLQLDTDEHMMWGDAGVGGFFIDPADLARGDFSRVMYNWDCH